MNKLIVAAAALLFGAQFALAQAPATEKKDTKAATAAPAPKKDEVAPAAKTASADAPKGEKKLTPQQNKMKMCNGQAAEKKLKGDERKAFMKDCLSNKDKK